MWNPHFSITILGKTRLNVNGKKSIKALGVHKFRVETTRLSYLYYTVRRSTKLQFSACRSQSQQAMSYQHSQQVQFSWEHAAYMVCYGKVWSGLFFSPPNIYS